MKSLKQLVVAAIFAVVACTGLLAQNVDMRATVPFDFQAGDRLMPAGEYVIHERGPWVIFNHVDGKAASALLTFGASGRGPAQNARLEFNRYGSAYFLTAVWNSFTQDGRQVPQTAREKELAKRGEGPVPAQVTLASSR
jgi:hypothetical protein